MNRAIFLDKDGTLIEDIPYNVNPDLIRLTSGAVEGLKKLKTKGYLLIVISNQSGIAHGYFQKDAIEQVKGKLTEILGVSEISLDGFFYCPHHPQGVVTSYTMSCNCRKPKPGMLLHAAKDYNINLSQSWMVGDILNDVEAGNNAGCKTILINNGNETEWEINDKRKPTTIVRDLNEAATFILQR